MASYKIIHTYKVQNTEASALLFGAELALKGYTNRVEARSYGHIMIAEDQKAVKFIRG